MNVSDDTTQYLAIASWVEISQLESSQRISTTATHVSQKPRFDLLVPLRRSLNTLEIKNRRFAHLLCRLIPAQCPFEQDIKLFGRTLFHIPPMCKLNPLYEELMMLRFQALSYLADECGEDVTLYC